jgi:hypothetical protein
MQKDIVLALDTHANCVSHPSLRRPTRCSTRARQHEKHRDIAALFEVLAHLATMTSNILEGAAKTGGAQERPLRR